MDFINFYIIPIPKIKPVAKGGLGERAISEKSVRGMKRKIQKNDNFS